MDDLISRQDAINLIQEDKIKLVEPYLSIYKSSGCIKEAETQVMTCDRHIEMIKNLPSVDVVERKKGEWIFNPTDAIEMMFTKPKCSECGFESADGGNFCSNCGSDMRKGKKKDDRA